MKNITSLISKTTLLLPALAVTMLVSAQRGDRDGAGRGGNMGGGGFSRQDRGGGVQPGRNFDQPRGASQPGRNVDQPRNGGYQPRDNNVPGNIGSAPRNAGGDNRPVFNNRNDNPVANRPQQNTSRYFDGQPGRNGQQRDNVYNRTPDQRDRMYGGNNRPVYTNNDRNRNYGYNNRGYNDYGYRGGNYGRSYSAPYRYAYHYPYYGQRYTSLNFHYNVIPFGGIGYCYNNGIFYRPFGGYFQVVAPPLGISIGILPFGYTRVYVGSYPYYYYGGTYYRQYDNYYQVVDPPLGAKLPALPQGAEETFINGQRYFEYNGTYYMEEYNINNQRLYTVVGVHGVLDDATVDRVLHGTAYQYDNNQPANRVVYSSLPENCTRVTINGQDYYKSPDDIYYQEITDGNNVSYEVVSGN